LQALYRGSIFNNACAAMVKVHAAAITPSLRHALPGGTMKTFSVRPLLVAGAVLFAVPPVAAQETATSYRQVISANPFGLLLELFNAEYERAMTTTSSGGFGGSYIDLDDDTYVNFDLFLRYYPQGRPFDGWAFGGKVGITRVEGSTYPGFGFDVNRSWLMGSSDRFYVGIGFGLKRLLGTEDADFDVRFIPTLRLVNIGFAF
jgi:hypothetical protein